MTISYDLQVICLDNFFTSQKLNIQVCQHSLIINTTGTHSGVLIVVMVANERRIYRTWRINQGEK